MNHLFVWGIFSKLFIDLSTLKNSFFFFFLKDKLAVWLSAMKLALLKEMKRLGPKKFLMDQSTLMNCMNKGPDIGRAIEAFLATGNIMSNSGLGLMQVCIFPF